jgi:hypothetical protein
MIPSKEEACLHQQKEEHGFSSLLDLIQVVDRLGALIREERIGNIHLIHESSELAGRDCYGRLTTTSMFVQVGLLESL